MRNGTFKHLGDRICGYLPKRITRTVGNPVIRQFGDVWIQ